MDGQGSTQQQAPVVRGMRDVLPTEAADRRRIAAAAFDVFDARGYGEVMTPAFERFEDLVRESGEAAAAQLFRFFDADGTLVALRSEMTTPVARLVGRRMADVAGAIRLCYSASVFREAPVLLGQAREFAQIGAELIGAAGPPHAVEAPPDPVEAPPDAVAGPSGDAEVLAVAAEVAAAAGVPDAVIAVGRVDLIRTVLADAGVTDDAARPMVDALGRGDLVTFSQLLGCAVADPRGARAIDALVRLDGNGDALTEARRLIDEARPGDAASESGPAACEATPTAAPAPGADMARRILDELEQTLALVESALGRQPVRLHFGMVRSFEYYTGMVFDVYAPGLGTALGGGGRYDRLLGEFGPPRPAAGFAFGVERLLQAGSPAPAPAPTPTPAPPPPPAPPRARP